MTLPRVASVCTLLLAVVVASGNAETILFGPESFQRGTGEPITERKTFETFGYEDPFVLHLLNGTPDGKNRCSSATVWLDGNIVLRPSDFSQTVSEKEEFVAAGEIAVLDVQLASAPGCQVTIRVDGTPRLIRPEGATVRYRNDIYLTFEPGAVAEPMRVEVLELPLPKVDTILAERNQDYRSHRKRVLGGILGKPSGLSFLAPVWASIPVLALEPGEIPVQVAVDIDANTYWLTDTNIRFDGQAHTAVMQIRHFSADAVAAIAKSPKDPCLACAYWESHPAECGYDVYGLPGQDRCCLLSRSDRETCPTASHPCSCCKDGMVTTVSEAASWELAFGRSDACVMATGRLTTTYHDCGCPNPLPPEIVCTPDGPAYPEKRISEKSRACESEMDINVKIVNPDPLLVCDEGTLHARLEATAKDGRRRFVTEDFLPQWVSYDNNIADFPDWKESPGLIRAFAPGDVTIQARAPDPDPRYSPKAVQRVNPRATAIGSSSALSVEVGELSVVELRVEGLCGPDMKTKCLAEWTPQDSDKLDVGVMLNLATLRGKAPGVVEVTAILRNSEHLPSWCKAEISAKLTVSVTGVEVTGIAPSTATDCRAEPVTIAGSGFVAGALVRFEGAASVSAEGVKVVNAETITATTPLNMTPGTYDVSVTTPGGATDRLPAALVVRPCSAPRYFVGEARFSHSQAMTIEHYIPQWGGIAPNLCGKPTLWGCGGSGGQTVNAGLVIYPRQEPASVWMDLAGVMFLMPQSETNPDAVWPDMCRAKIVSYYMNRWFYDDRRYTVVESSADGVRLVMEWTDDYLGRAYARYGLLLAFSTAHVSGTASGHAEDHYSYSVPDGDAALCCSPSAEWPECLRTGHHSENSVVDQAVEFTMQEVNKDAFCAASLLGLPTGVCP